MINSLHYNVHKTEPLKTTKEIKEENNEIDDITLIIEKCWDLIHSISHWSKTPFVLREIYSYAVSIQVHNQLYGK